ncbi:YjfI family protein [Pseudomonas viridiflava]|uniref:YjfI family protein n=1 Tax=Pseudomonas viridiflava TaxID=33069 RepID=A0ABU7NDA9_PSEVI|nr:YjfI family protein [Pseudomonas viridiflava]MBI6578088.1 YjfI family protein [Pseudomonas viridiflava]MBI6607364.1 YjfI family protein [Pseudomonas viridiflava]MBI6637907.1 YjfI family protein [Pseudomonas viridiflava]MBI6867388.1 YjfI family protein [Pseudomonas viridiflava]MEE3938438.1 YjfI family protein [Pseudomonas viridiflava]
MPRKTKGDNATDPAKASKSSTDYMREMRLRLKDAGLVKREFWIRPENVDALRGIEKALRQPFLGDRIKLEDFMTENTNWTISSLQKALSELDLVTEGRIEMGVIEGDAAGIKLTMADFGDLPIYIAVEGDQILADATLIEVNKIKDVAAFNGEVLRSRDLFPLSSVGIERLADGQEVYCLFGALSAASSLTVIVQEILTLADNVIRAAEAFEDHFIY